MPFSVRSSSLPALLVITLLALTITACTQPPPPAPVVDLAAEEARLRANEAAWVKAFADKDVAKIASLYTPGAVMMVPGAPAMKGPDAISASLKQMLTDPNIKLEFSAARVQLSQAGDMASTAGPYTLTMSNPKTKKPVTEKGNYVTVFKKQTDGSWKIVEDIITPDGSH